MTIMKIVMAILQRSKPKPMQTQNLDPIIKEEENGVLSLKKESSTSLQDQDLDLNPHWHQLKPLLCPIHLTTIHLMFIY